MPLFGMFQKDENYSWHTQNEKSSFGTCSFTLKYEPFLWESLNIDKCTWNKNVHKYKVKAG